MECEDDEWVMLEKQSMDWYRVLEHISRGVRKSSGKLDSNSRKQIHVFSCNETNWVLSI
jgi:hypothetical protein